MAFAAVLAQHGIDHKAGNPWNFSSAAAARRRLEAAGFEVHSCELVPRPTPMPTDISGWLDTFAASYFGVVPEELRAQVRTGTLLLQRLQLSSDCMLPGKFDSSQTNCLLIGSKICALCRTTKMMVTRSCPLDAQVQQQVVDALEENLDVDGTCVVDYVRLRFKAVKPRE